MIIEVLSHDEFLAVHDDDATIVRANGLSHQVVALTAARHVGAHVGDGGGLVHGECRVDIDVGARHCKGVEAVGVKCGSDSALSGAVAGGMGDAKSLQPMVSAKKVLADTNNL